MDTTGRRDTHGAARAVRGHLPRVAEARAPVRAAAQRIFLLRLRLAVGVGLAGRLVLERLVEGVPVSNDGVAKPSLVIRDARRRSHGRVDGGTAAWRRVDAIDAKLRN